MKVKSRVVLVVAPQDCGPSVGSIAWRNYGRPTSRNVGNILKLSLMSACLSLLIYCCCQLDNFPLVFLKTRDSHLGLFCISSVHCNRIVPQSLLGESLRHPGSSGSLKPTHSGKNAASRQKSQRFHSVV